MNKIEITEGAVHKLPAILRKALVRDEKSLAALNDITPLVRNEYTCSLGYAKLVANEILSNKI